MYHTRRSTRNAWVGWVGLGWVGDGGCFLPTQPPMGEGSTVIIKTFEQYLKRYWPDRWKEHIIATYPPGEAGRIFAQETLEKFRQSTLNRR